MSRSPQIILRERDQSSFPATSSDTVIAIVGFGTKGPIGKAVELSSRNAFVDNFGTIPERSPWGHLAAYKAFRQGRVIFYRVANDSAASAERVISGKSPAKSGYQEFSRNQIINFGEYSSSEVYEFTLNADDAGLRDVTVTSPSTGDWELSSLAKSINTAIAALTAPAVDATAVLDTTTKRIRIISGTTGITSTIALAAVAAGTNLNLLTLLGGVETAVDGTALVAQEDSDNIIFRSREKGTESNKIAIQKVTTFNQVEERTIHTINVWFDGAIVETFEDVSLEIEDSNFFARLINREGENGGSRFVYIPEYLDFDDDETVEFENGVYELGVGDDVFAEGNEITEYDHVIGNDGIPESGGAGLFVNALATNGDLANTEKFNFHILITPDNGSQSTQNAAITLAEYRKDFLYIVDSPFGLSYTEVVEWHNGNGSGRESALNSSFAATYWPWLKDTNTADGEYIWCPPSVFLGEKLMEVDNTFAPWYAPAGDLRGRLIANDTEFSPNLAQRDFIYARPNAVNPIVNFSTKGIVIYGQKTTLRSRSALDRVNVRRMAIYASKLIKESMESFIFEPHVPESWARATDFINRILEPIRRDNGLEDYQVLINGDTNDQDAIANNVMKGIIRLVPVNAIEVIELNIAFLSPGVSIS